MLEIKFVKENLNLVKESSCNRGIEIDWDFFNIKNAEIKKIMKSIEKLSYERNFFSSKIAEMKKKGEDVNNLIIEMRELSFKIKKMKNEIKKDQELLLELLLSIPNFPHYSVPFGKDETDNIVVKEIKTKFFLSKPLSHSVLGQKLGLFDLKRASKVSGSRFSFYTGFGALMRRAIINFMLDVHIMENGYCEISPPYIVSKESLVGSGQLPKFESDLFKIKNSSNYLIPTAEVPLINIHRNEIINESILPISYVAYSPCFRSEAGSYGKDLKGLIRHHQFDKIELVKFSKPENSYDELEVLLNNAESILKKLKIPYRIVNLCIGDLGFNSSKTYDIEAWMPSQNKYIEVSSCSNTESFQSRRSNIRFKSYKKKGTSLVHILNGSGLAVGRTMAAIIENYQDSSGNIIIPEVLRPYMNNTHIINESIISNLKNINSNIN